MVSLSSEMLKALEQERKAPKLETELEAIMSPVPEAMLRNGSSLKTIAKETASGIPSMKSPPKPIRDQQPIVYVPQNNRRSDKTQKSVRRCYPNDVSGLLVHTN